MHNARRKEMAPEELARVTIARTSRRHKKRAAAVAERTAYYKVHLEATKEKLERRDALLTKMAKEVDELKAELASLKAPEAGAAGTA